MKTPGKQFLTKRSPIDELQRPGWRTIAQAPGSLMDGSGARLIRHRTGEFALLHGGKVWTTTREGRAKAWSGDVRQLFQAQKANGK